MSCFATLKEKGLKLTRPRRVILDYIHDRGNHLTAEEIINFVHEQYPRINKSTVYRTLDLLEKNACVYKNESMGKIVYHHAENKNHIHLVCIKCGNTFDCEEDIFESAEKAIKGKYNFQVDFGHVVVSGLCESCKKSTA